MIKLLIAPHPMLRAQCVPVSFDDAPRLRHLEREMVEVMTRARGIGLAAPQVRLLLRVFTMKPMGRAPIALFNPEVVSTGGGYVTDREGCLSFPGQTRYIRRPAQVAVRYRTATGDERSEVFVGYDARCVQHEIDHLDGVTFDLLPVSQSAMAMKARDMARGRR